MTTNKVTKKKSNLPSVDFGIPDNYDSGISQEDVQIPSILMLQKMTELVELEDRDWKPGQFYNMATDEVIDSFNALIIKYFVTVRLFGDKDSQTGRADIERFSSDGIHWNDTGDTISPSEFTYKENGKFAKKSFHYLALLKGEKLPVILTFKGASAKMAKKFNTHLIRLFPLWRSYFGFKAISEENAGNKYFVLKAEPKPKKHCSQEEADLCRGFWDMSNDSRISSNEMNESDNDDNDDEEPVY